MRGVLSGSQRWQVVDALQAQLKVKKEAFKLAGEIGPRYFMPDDFGIPQIEELIEIFEEVD